MTLLIRDFPDTEREELEFEGAIWLEASLGEYLAFRDQAAHARKDRPVLSYKHLLLDDGRLFIYARPAK